MVTALKCPHCSAALPAPTPGASFVQCTFCGGVAQLAMPMAPAAAPVAAREPQPVVPNGPTRDDLERFVDAFRAALGAGVPFVSALQSAAQQELGRFGDQTAMTFGVAHLAIDFERESGAKVQHDGQVVSRLAEAWYKTAIEVAQSSSGSTELNLPFLTATESGPKHLARTITGADLARMTSGPPGVAAAAPPPAPAPPTPEPEPKKKKKGWFW